jgi:AcrR family transcriptional regulator
MPRTLNPVAHAVRRDAFIDAAQRLLQTRGYEETSIQDVLDELDASRGAFYHYFASKEDLLEAVVERMTDAATASLGPVVSDPDLSALHKFEGVFTGIARWKAERTDLLMALTRVWLADDNAIVREKFRRGLVIRLTPLLSAIVRQGVVEGSFTVSSPDDVSRVLVSLIQGANEIAVELFFAREAGTVTFDQVERSLAAYADAFERILGTPAGSLTIGDPATLRAWYG